MHYTVGFLVVLIVLMLVSPAKAFLCYEANQVVPYDVYFHDDTGTRTVPTAGPTSNIRITEFDGSPDTYTSLSAPTQQNSETGRYGGTYTISGAPTYGTYRIAVQGTVETSKVVGAVCQGCVFTVKETCPALKPT